MRKKKLDQTVSPKNRPVLLADAFVSQPNRSSSSYNRRWYALSWFESIRRYLNYTPSLIKIMPCLAEVDHAVNLSLAEKFDEVAGLYPDNLAMIYQDQTITYRYLQTQSYQVTQWALAQGFSCGQNVGLIMDNKPEFVALFLGLNRIGVAVAMVHPQLKGEAMKSAIGVVDCQAWIVESELMATVKNALGDQFDSLDVWSDRPSDQVKQHLSAWFKDADIETLSPEVFDIPKRTVACYVFTSGTTGVPKACIISNRRSYSVVLNFSYLFGLGLDSQSLIVSPLCHSLGFHYMLAALLSGGSICLHQKFSVSGFWRDVTCYPITDFAYIGEIALHLMKNAPNKLPKHSLRVMWGLQIRDQVRQWWSQSMKVSKCIELYAGTESNIISFLLDQEANSCGWSPFFFRANYGPRVIRVDEDTGEVIREANGLAKQCRPGEVGELCGWIADDDNETRGLFEGYTDVKATEAMKLADVKTHGDVWFRSGDLGYLDERGYLYFSDRRGDTYRWRGENVSTRWVENIVVGHEKIKEVTVYGVTVPGYEGKVGMMAMVAEKELSMDALSQYVMANLPVYAIPMFIRVEQNLQATITAKHQKKHLVAQGFKGGLNQVPMWVFDRSKVSYVEFDTRLAKQVETLTFRL